MKSYMRDPREQECFLIDILVAIDALERRTEEIKIPDDLIRDEVLFGFVARQCEIIGEAMSRVLCSGYSRYAPGEWRKVVNFRNIVAHGYFGVDCDEVFYVLHKKVPALRAQLVEFIQNNVSMEKLKPALNRVVLDMSKMGREECVDFLKDHFLAMIETD